MHLYSSHSLLRPSVLFFSDASRLYRSARGHRDYHWYIHNAKKFNALGSNFYPISTPVCQFGSYEVLADVIDGSTMQCTVSPQSAYGYQTLSISMDGSNFVYAGNFDYYCNSSIICNAHGYCGNSANGLPCICDAGWTGTTCDSSIKTHPKYP
jgi:hypothetical protein